MPSTTGIRRKLSPALLAGAPYRLGDRMAERYVVKDAIGIGPLGYVFRASDEQQGFDVAVKMIHPRFVQTAEEREAFTRAIEPARRFMQPSLSRVHDLGVDQGWPFITYSFLDGLTLRRMIDSRLAKGQTFTLDEVEPFLGQLAAALEAAHPVGAHADLKPENVVILPDMLRLIDWGVARAVPRLPFVQAQRQKSTHRYLAPEVVSGGDADPRADLYALGVLVGEMLTGLTPDEDIPELRLTAPELPEAVEGFYRKALNERPEARFRSVRELYEEFAALLAPSAGPVAIPPGTSLAAAAAQAEAAAPHAEPVEELEPIPETEAPVAVVPEASASEAPASPEPIAAASLPRFEGHPPETPRHTREVVALEPPDWSAATAAPAESPPPRPGSGRWRSLKMWDEEADTSGSAERSGPAAAAEATGPELPVNTQPALALVGRRPAASGSLLDHSEEEADAAVAGLTEIGGEEEGSDEPLLAEALGVDLVVDGDEPVPASRASGRPTPSPAALTPVPVAEPPAQESSRAPATSTPTPVPEPPRVTPVTASPVREIPRLVPDSRPWPAEGRPAPYRREMPEGPRSREAASARPSPVAAAAASLAETPAASARSVLPPPPSIAPLRSPAPRLAHLEPQAASPTPVSIVPEPSPTRQEPVVSAVGETPTPPVATPQVASRGAGSWSPAELLAQVIAEIKSEERGAGLPQGTSWEPVPLDATQPISTDEVAARLAAAEAAAGPATVSVRAADDEDLPALRHEAGRAGIRMALLTAAGLIVGILGGWTIVKLSKPPRPQVERISEVRPAQAPAPAQK
ncbi:MAG TPA: protein kinase [Myxococcaceae bacterium]